MILPMLFHYFNAINFIPYFIIEKFRLITNLLWGALKMVFVGRWSIGNVQIIYLWYDRFIPNPNSFDDVSRTNHCDIELVISMFLVHLDLCSANISRSWNTMCFTGIHQNTEMESSINWWCAWMTKNGIMTWINDVGSVPSTQMHLPVYIKYICLRFVTKGGRGRNDIIIQSAIQLAVIKIIIHQNIIRMYGTILKSSMIICTPVNTIMIDP